MRPLLNRIGFFVKQVFFIVRHTSFSLVVAITSEMVARFNEKNRGFNEQRDGFNEKNRGFNERRDGFSEKNRGFNEQRDGFSEKIDFYGEMPPSFNEENGRLAESVL